MRREAPSDLRASARRSVRAFMLSLAVAGLVGASSPADAVNRNDVAIWFVNQVAAPIDDRFSLHLMIQNRWVEDIGYQRTVVRPWVAIKLPKGFRLALGYDAHIFENPRSFTEQRAWQRIEYAHRFDWFVLLTHVWIEERFFSGSPVAWRGRFQLGGAFLLPHDFTLVVRNDFLINLNTTPVIRRTGLAEDQLFFTLSRPLVGGLRVEGGYLMQYLNPPVGDVANHTITFGFAYETNALLDLVSGRD